MTNLNFMSNFSDNTFITCLGFNNGSTMIMRREPLLETNPKLAISYIVIVGIALLVGICGNVLILMIFTVMRGINKSGKEFMMNLAIADLCVTAIADPLCIVGVAKGEQFFDGQMWTCELVAGMCATACSCAFLSLTLLSLSRYIFLCHNHLYDKLFSRVSCVIMCLGCWLMATVFEAPKFLGWGGYRFDEKNHQCIWDRTASLSYALFVCISTLLQLIMIGVFYFLIFLQIWKSKRNVFKLDSDNPLRMRRAWNETVRSSKVLFCVFLVFVVCWTPYCITVIIDVADNFPTEVHLFVTLLAHLHSSINCIIYTTGNKKFRRGIVRLFRYRTPMEPSFAFHIDYHIAFPYKI